MPIQGLSEDQVKKKLREFGENKLSEAKKVSWLKILLLQFKSPLIYILVLAFGTTAILGDYVDSVVIGAAVVMNTLLGFYQEMKAERSLEALSSMMAPMAKVIRDGKRVAIEANKVVVGDVCVLELGERIPADGEVLTATDLSLNEAILTGESMSVGKQGKGKVFMGTTVFSGIGFRRVTEVGQNTEVGKIADRLIETKEEKTPLQKQIDSFSKKLAWMVGVISLIILVMGLIVGDPFIEIFSTAVAVAVSAIPEGLAVSLTVILAIGMQRIFKKKSLVRKLVAAETLGSVTVICSDKTGTLTEGKMKVVKAVMGEKESSECSLEDGQKLLVRSAVLCNDMRDPLEIGMMEWALDQKIEGHQSSSDDLSQKYPRLKEIPFNPDNKFIATLHKQEKGKNLLLVSGAPEIMVERSSLSEKKKKEWLEKFQVEGEKGHRLVGFGLRELDKDTLSKDDIVGLRCVGYLAFEDPVRVGVKEALVDARKAGIKVKVITGDYRATAEAVMRKLGLFTLEELRKDRSKLVMEGYELEKISDEELLQKIDEVKLFARTNPEQKLRIVGALQEKGEVVAMTGDGVNDAPAVKKADIGIVVNEASAVAKETADMVLLDSNFATIVMAVEEGRGIFVNLKKIILYLLSDSFAEVILVLGSMLLGLPLPVTAAQILWINLVDDGLPDFALTLEPKPADLMRSKPLGHKRELMDKEVKLLIGLISLVTGILSLGVFYWYFKVVGNLELARTMSFTLLAVSTLLYVFSVKSLKEPLWKEKWWNNPWLLGAVAIGFSFQLLAIYLPSLQVFLKTVSLGWSEWGVVMLGSGLVIVLIEGVKWRFNHLVESELRV